MQFIAGLIFDIFSALISLLPLSPFPIMLKSIETDVDVLGYVNWFIPFDTCLTLFEIWLAAIIVYLIYKNIDKILKLFSYLRLW